MVRRERLPSVGGVPFDWTENDSARALVAREKLCFSDVKEPKKANEKKALANRMIIRAPVGRQFVS